MTTRVLGCIGLFVCGLAGCQRPPAVPVWSEADELPLVPADSAHADWLRLWRAWPAPEPSFTGALTEGWRYATGDPAEGLQVGLDRRPALDDVVNLPHRIPIPDTPMWYEREVDAGVATGLHINADDGAQVFQDGRRLEPVMGEYFLFDTSPFAGLLTVRVLNNALNGGLRGVYPFAGEAFEAYSDETARRVDARGLLFDAIQLADPTPAQQNAVVRALTERSREALFAGRREIPTALLAPHLPLATPPEVDSIFSFSAWGDSQGGWAVFQALANQMAVRPDAFSIGLGDLVSNGAEEGGWLSFAMALQPLLRAMPVYAVAGNHDYDGLYNDLVPRLYLQHTREDGRGPPYFSWSHAGAFFMAVDPNNTFPLGFDAAQLAWIDATMASDAWREANWRFVLLHQAPYSQGWQGYHGDTFIRDLVEARAESHRIDVVLTGHSHNYERLSKTYGNQKTHFFVLGGAGGGLEPPESSDYPVMDRVIKQHHFAVFSVTPGGVEVEVIGLDGAELDRWTSH